MKLFLALTALAATLALIAADPATTTANGEKVVDQKDKTFSEKEVTLKPGETLVFRNSDDVAHNVFSTSKENAFSSQIMKPGEDLKVEFKNEGTVEVRCAFHPKMKLVVTVKK